MILDGNRLTEIIPEEMENIKSVKKSLRTLKKSVSILDFNEKISNGIKK